MEKTDKLDRALRPQSIAECEGQDEVRANLQVYVASAKARNEPVEHMLFCGHAGLGKTTLAGALAADMGGRLVTVNSPSIKTKGEIAAILGQLGPGDILFLDEIHALKPALQELLYPVMEDFKLEIASGNSTVAVDLPAFTIVGATTHVGKLSKPMRDRFGAVSELQLFRPDELARVVLRAAKKMGFVMEQEGAMEIGRRAQGTPRIALRILRRVRDFALFQGEKVLDAMFVDEVCTRIGVDRAGLDPIARRVLRLLSEKKKPIGLQAIASSLGEAVETIEDCVEPFLLAEGMVERAQSGRCITPKGLAHLQACGVMN